MQADLGERTLGPAEMSEHPVPNPAPRFFLLAGEASGDTHGAALIARLKERFPMATFHGLGGPKMRALAPDLEDWSDEAAVLGLWEVLKKYGYFRRKMDETIATIGTLRPDVVIPIDYPGFNLRLAKALRQRGFQGKIAYYISPQVWAWKRGRIREMARTLDLMMCIFPFEKELYEASGLSTVFVGHPLADEFSHLEPANVPREENLVGLFPGSRSREIEALFPAMVQAAALLHASRPELRFVTAAVNERLATRLTAIAAEHGASVKVSSGDIHTLMRRCSCAVIASGTATLEAAFLGLPYCLVYRVAWLTALAARVLMKVPYLGIVNNLAGREVVRELLQEDATAEPIARELQRLLDSFEARRALSQELLATAATLGTGGAPENAAKAIAGLLTGR